MPTPEESPRVVPLRPPPPPSQRSGRVMMLVLLAAWATMFVTLVLIFAVLRAQAPVWPPPRLGDIPRGAGVGVTVLALVPGGLLEAARGWVQRGAGRRVGVVVFGALIAAMAMLALEAGLLAWVRRIELPGDATLAWMTMLAFHFFQAVLGLPGLLVVAIRAFQGRYRPQRHVGLRAWAWYWQFGAAVWVILVALALLP